jgi:hypothetical protein
MKVPASFVEKLSALCVKISSSAWLRLGRGGSFGVKFLRYPQWLYLRAD